MAKIDWHVSNTLLILNLVKHEKLTANRLNTFFNVLQISVKSPGAILLVEASLVSSATASFLSDHLVAF